MNTFFEKIQEKIAPTAGKIGSQKHLLCIRDGMMGAMPLIIIGSMFLVFGNLPINGYTEWLASHGNLMFGLENWSTVHLVLWD